MADQVPNLLSRIGGGKAYRSAARTMIEGTSHNSGDASVSLRSLDLCPCTWTDVSAGADFPPRFGAAQATRGQTGIQSGYLRAATYLLTLCIVLYASASLAAGQRSSPVERALGFLFTQQVGKPLKVGVDGIRNVDFPGNWPQYFHLQGTEEFRVREVSPFMVAFIHHSLTGVVEENRRALGLSQRDLRLARLMRQRAVAFMKGFESPPGSADAGTFAFWPYDAAPYLPGVKLTILLTAWLQGPILGGQRVPINLRIYPSTLAIPSDADVTATTYATLLDDAIFDGGSGSEVAFERFFLEWRDLGVVPRRLNPDWLPPASGAFLTWLTYRDRPFPLFPNDVDLVVNANVLYALARYDRLDLPGVEEAVEYINLVTALGLHRDRLEEITDYYPDNLAFQYVVSRAFHEGPVTTLEPAIAILADDLEASVLFRAEGTAYWDRGEPHLNTAFAVLTLLNAGRETAIIDQAIEYLVAEQNADGGFDEATFFVGRNDGGQVFEFTSASFSTAMALEALVRHRVDRCSRSKDRPRPSQPQRCR